MLRSGILDIIKFGRIKSRAVQVVEESYNPNRTYLSVEFTKNRRKTENYMEKVRENQNELANARDIAEIIEISTERTSVILSNMDGIEPVGENRNRMYKFKNK